MGKLINYIKENSFKTMPESELAVSQTTKSQSIIRRFLNKISKSSKIDEDLKEAIDDILSSNEIFVSISVEVNSVEAEIYKEGYKGEYMIPRVAVDRKGIYIYTNINQNDSSVPLYLDQSYSSFVDILFNNQIVEAF